MSEWHLASLSEQELQAIRRLERETGLILVAWDRGARRRRADDLQEPAREISPDISALAGLGNALRTGASPLH